MTLTIFRDLRTLEFVLSAGPDSEVRYQSLEEALNRIAEWFGRPKFHDMRDLKS